MEYLKDRTFELFRYTLPGVFIIIVSLLFDKNVTFPTEIVDIYFSKISTGGTIGLLALGFVVGFVMDEISGKIIGLVVKNTKIEKDYTSNSNLTTPEKYVLIREVSPVNYKMVENLNVYRGMFKNLVLGLIVLGIVSIIKISYTNYKILWGVILLISIMSIYSLILKYKKFTGWVLQDVDSIIDLKDQIVRFRKQSDNIGNK